MIDKLTFEKWKDAQNVTISQESINALREYHGIDGNEQVDIMLQGMYNDYLQEDNDMTT